MKITKEQLKQMIREEAAKLEESSINRILSHVNKKTIDSWGIITAFRFGNSLSANLKRNQLLSADLQKLGHGFIKLEGHWLESPDPNKSYKEFPKEQLIDVTEVSYFVPKIKLNEIKYLMKKYNQDSVVFSSKDFKNGNVFILYNAGDIQDLGATASRFNIEQAYSKFKKHEFRFI